MVYVGTLEKIVDIGIGYFIDDPQKGMSPIESVGYPCERQCKQSYGKMIWIKDKFCDRLSAVVPDAPKPIVRAKFNIEKSDIK